MNDSGVDGAGSLMRGKARKKKKLPSNAKRKQLTSLNGSRNASMNASSVVKLTLRANNRALARALGTIRHELQTARETILHITEREQQLLVELNTLRSVAGLKNDAIEKEVESRMEQRMKDVRVVLNKICSSQLSTVELIHEAMNACGYSGQAGRGSRSTSSLDSRATLTPTPTDEEDSSRETNPISKPIPQNTIYYRGPKANLGLPSRTKLVQSEGPEETATADTEVTANTAVTLENEGQGDEEPGNAPAADSLPALTQPSSSSSLTLKAMQLPDLSMIMEQSCLFDIDLPFADEQTTANQPESDEKELAVGRRGRSSTRSGASERNSATVYVPPARNQAAVRTGEGDSVSSDHRIQRRVTRSRSRSRSCSMQLGAAPLFNTGAEEESQNLQDLDTEPGETDEDELNVGSGAGDEVADLQARGADLKVEPGETTEEEAGQVELTRERPASRLSRKRSRRSRPARMEGDADEETPNISPTLSAKPMADHSEHAESAEAEASSSPMKTIKTEESSSSHSAASESENEAQRPAIKARSKSLRLNRQEVKKTKSVDSSERQALRKKRCVSSGDEQEVKKAKSVESSEREALRKKRCVSSGDEQEVKKAKSVESSEREALRKKRCVSSGDESSEERDTEEGSGDGDDTDTVNVRKPDVDSAMPSSAANEHAKHNPSPEKVPEACLSRRRDTFEVPHFITLEPKAPKATSQKSTPGSSGKKKAPEKEPGAKTGRTRTKEKPEIQNTGEERKKDAARRGTYFITKSPGKQDDGGCEEVQKNSPSVPESSGEQKPSTRRGTFCLPKPRVVQEDKARRGTYFVPKPISDHVEGEILQESEPVDDKDAKTRQADPSSSRGVANNEDVTARRGTFCVTAKPAEEEDDIMNESCNILVDSSFTLEADAATAGSDAAIDIHVIPDSPQVTTTGDMLAAKHSDAYDDETVIYKLDGALLGAELQKPKVDKARSFDVEPVEAVPEEAERTVCMDEDMDFTDMLPPVEDSQFQVPPPSFITQESAQEPSFLRNVSTESIPNQAICTAMATSVQETLPNQPPKPDFKLDSDGFKVPGLVSRKVEQAKVQNRASKKDVTKDKAQVLQASATAVKAMALKGGPLDKKVGQRRKPAQVRNKGSVSDSDGEDTVFKEAEDRGKPSIRNAKTIDTQSSDESSTETDAKDHQASSDSDSDKGKDKIKTKFRAYLDKPGKITFTAGRKDLMTVAGQTTSKARSKGRSTLLPKPKQPRGARSKPRLLPGALKGSAADSGKVKSVFDLSMSLSESMTMAQAQTFSEFVGRQPVHPKPCPEVMNLDNVGVHSATESPHGIMLVLGNGKRTKPRSKCSKSVSYNRKLANTKLMTPAPPPAVSFGGETQVLDDAGGTPKRALTTREKSPPPQQRFCEDTPKKETIADGKDVPCILTPVQKHTKETSQKLGKSPREELPESQVVPTKETTSRRSKLTTSGAQSGQRGALMTLNRGNDDVRDDNVHVTGSLKKGRKIPRQCPADDVEYTPKEKERSRPVCVASVSSVDTSFEEVIVRKRPRRAVLDSESEQSEDRESDSPVTKRKVISDSDSEDEFEKPSQLNPAPKAQEDRSPIISPAKAKAKSKAEKEAALEAARPAMCSYSQSEKAGVQTSKKHSKSTSSAYSQPSVDAEKENDPEEEAPTRRRRTAAVCYKEPRLASKLRQGDEGTSTIYKAGENPRSKQKISGKDKKRSSSKRKPSIQAENIMIKKEIEIIT